jgi:hypothetical protein
MCALILKDSSEMCLDDIKAKWGLYIWGELEKGPLIKHTDSRDAYDDQINKGLDVETISGMIDGYFDEKMKLMRILFPLPRTMEYKMIFVDENTVINENLIYEINKLWHNSTSEDILYSLNENKNILFVNYYKWNYNIDIVNVINESLHDYDNSLSWIVNILERLIHIKHNNNDDKREC